MDRFLKPGGVFISSGIIYMKEEEVKDAINNNSNLQLSKVVIRVTGVPLWQLRNR